MFEKAPSEVFKPINAPCAPPNDFYMKSEQIASAEEDLTQAQKLGVKLCDFGTGIHSLPFK